MKVRNLGRKSLEEVIAKLNSFGFTLKNDDEYSKTAANLAAIRSE